MMGLCDSYEKCIYYNNFKIKLSSDVILDISVVGNILTTIGLYVTLG